MSAPSSGAPPSAVERAIREGAPRALTRLVRRNGDFAACEDAVQEALVAAATQWPVEGLPANPEGWLTRVAQRRYIEALRSESARRRREETATRLDVAPTEVSAAEDDQLTLLLLCCHPSLTTASQVALTLRAVGGLTTSEIARAFLTSEATIGQRISRAKERIRQSGARFRLPPPDELGERVASVMQVLYLVFTEGHTASADARLVRVDLCAEAIRLARQLRDRLPDDGEVAGLLALMLLTDARRPARVDVDGNLIPLSEQDRTRWDRALIEEGVALTTQALATKPVGPFQLQAAIAAVHDEAPTSAGTDWPQILSLYDLLQALTPGPMIALNRIVAVTMVHGAARGLDALDSALAAYPTLGEHHRTDAVRGHLLEMTGDTEAARLAYQRAARSTLSIPEQRYLLSRAARLPK